MSLLATRRVEKWDCTVKECHGWYQLVHHTGVVRGVPAYWCHRRMSVKKESVCRAGV